MGGENEEHIFRCYCISCYFPAGAKNTAIPRRRIFSHDISEQFQRSCEILQGWPNLLRASNWVCLHKLCISPHNAGPASKSNF